MPGSPVYRRNVGYEESYQGWQVFLTTTQTAEGAWAWTAEVVDGGRRESVVGTRGAVYGSEGEAHTAARSAAAATIDRARISRGKPSA